MYIALTYMYMLRLNCIIFKIVSCRIKFVAYIQPFNSRPTSVIHRCINLGGGRDKWIKIISMLVNKNKTKDFMKPKASLI